MLLIEM
ncbi:hypothetical protein F383_23872 [Gossypium arboreum]|nr:hypothetical protein F383_23872 [Gossypium arboreum]